jgi:hypothetical protein
MNLSWFRDWFRLLRKEAKDWQLARSHRRRLAQVCVSDLPRSGNRTQPRVEALRNPGYPILNVDRPEGGKEKRGFAGYCDFCGPGLLYSPALAKTLSLLQSYPLLSPIPRVPQSLHPGLSPVTASR